MSDENRTIAPVQPVLDPMKEYEEINSYVVFWGLFYAAVFTLAVGYLCLKIGQTVDAFAPVSVLAMGTAVILKRQNAFAETVHIQALASSSTNTLAGAMFFLPALYIWNVTNVTFVQMVVPIILGGVLGVLLCIMFRRYFCEEMHYVYPFPSGRAAAEVLMSNEGSKAKLMIGSGVVALVYDFVLNSLGWWEEVIRTTTFKWGSVLADKTKLTAAVDTDAALLGLGYFTGLRYAAIIAAGSFFSWFVCIPILYFLAPEHVMMIGGKEILLGDAPIRKVFLDYVRHIGIGMLAMAGIIGLISMSKVVANVVKQALSDIFSSKKVEVNVLRTQRDIPTSWIGLGIILCTVLFALYFHFMYAETFVQTVVAFLIVLIMSFLLSVVGISSIAYTGTEPVSGMTIFMIIISAVSLAAVGVSGQVGMIAVLMMASFIGTTIGMAGNFMSELKVAHMTGATPKKMEQWQIVGTIMCAVLSVGVMILLNNAYGFVGDHALNAPQANAMAAIIEPMMTGGSAQWPLYMAGALFAIILWMVKVPPLAFALGTYLPMEINTPLLVGGLIAYFVQNSTKDTELAELRFSKGSTIASGLVAGGAIGSLFSAVLRIIGVDVFAQEWVESPAATYLGIVMYLVLCTFLYKVAMYVKDKKQSDGTIL
ncbi:OPT family oligopeptide transporter [Veillonella caviae]|uniref:OPT family oligopeptide transporter n=1 Tax=Veillonella caviae TaxID=248316 RepID=UPI0023A86C2A|nr:oligopeptide transporter, OPT family [Veillonella caviae]MCI5707884.1 oligopeptide transporter, OPT family [Veillonella caviae]MCI7693512.1 oligopeptide transporter, OPT family [Veillonella caviae]MDD7291142.1 oligopeptide transporter, OPT family [Veillonella caviae]MDY4745820.1 oligopeptide transporter, OPT family [Veillonella caviae]MDY5253135.1 oligopeptide transporter, OPT family [Veillonella caviae]